MADNDTLRSTGRIEYLPPEAPGVGMEIHPLRTNDGAGNVAPFRASRFTLAPGATSPVDVHAVKELWLVSHGTGVLTCNGQVLRVQPGDAIFFDSLHSHQIHNDGAQPFHAFSIWW